MFRAHRRRQRMLRDGCTEATINPETFDVWGSIDGVGFCALAFNPGWLCGKTARRRITRMERGR